MQSISIQIGSRLFSRYKEQTGYSKYFSRHVPFVSTLPRCELMVFCFRRNRKIGAGVIVHNGGRKR